MAEQDPDRQRLLTALIDMEAALTENVERSQEIQRRVHWFRQQIERGASAGELVSAETSPRAVEMLTENMTVLETVGSDFRFELASALRREGLTIEAIAGLFAVTRQRISALLRKRS
jgi:hypothetical protein